MKVFQKIFMLAMIAGSMVLASCGGDEAATVSVKVLKAGKAQVGELVYMYNGSSLDGIMEHKVHAIKNVATGEDGIADFSISSADFGLGNNKATFVFETFDADENVNGKIAVTVKSGEKKEATLVMQ